MLKNAEKDRILDIIKYITVSFQTFLLVAFRLLCGVPFETRTPTIVIAIHPVSCGTAYVAIGPLTFESDRRKSRTICYRIGPEETFGRRDYFCISAVYDEIIPRRERFVFGFDVCVRQTFRYRIFIWRLFLLGMYFGLVDLTFIPRVLPRTIVCARVIPSTATHRRYTVGRRPKL